MEDKKMMKIIQENYEKEHKKYLESIREKKEKKETRLAITILIMLMIVSVSLISHMNEKAIEKCMSKGNSYNYCLVEVNK